MLALSLGYKNYRLIKNSKNINFKIKDFLKCKGPALLEVIIGTGSIKNLIRPRNFKKIKKRFMN